MRPVMTKQVLGSGSGDKEYKQVCVWGGQKKGSLEKGRIYSFPRSYFPINQHQKKGHFGLMEKTRRARKRTRKFQVTSAKLGGWGESSPPAKNYLSLQGFF